MTHEEFVKAMRQLQSTDTEGAHLDADKLMCDLLRSLGFDEGVKIFEDMKRWYA